MSSIWDIINIPLGWIIKISYQLTHNYALALFLFALILQVILFPLGIKQQKNSVKQASLRPKEMAIRKKYAGRTDKPTQQKLNEEIMALYQRENFNPMGGCLPMLIQFPILISLYNVVTSPLKYICSFSVDVINNIQAKIYEMLIASGAEESAYAMFEAGRSVRQIDLITKMRELGVSNFVDGSGSAITEEVLPNFTIFGGMLDLSQIPSFTNFSLLLLIPLLTLVVTLGSTWLTRKLMYNPNPEAQNDISMKIMNLSMPLLSVYITFTVAAAIGLYWIFRNILSLVQQFILSKMLPIPKFTDEDYKAAERELNIKSMSKKQQKKMQKVRSLHRIDDEDDEDETTSTSSDSADDEEDDGRPKLKEGVSPDEAPKLKDDKRNDK
ncbi:MAG: YidC/Oxa1 family membrane protein insertase [Clostridiales bacterium]|nr:YidC/Oxa1 family membrane protein insertase [Clostridiales bacterium]